MGPRRAVRPQRRSARAEGHGYSTLMKEILAALVLILCLAAPGLAGGWQARIVDHPTNPSYFWAIDKKAQTFYTFGRKSPLSVIDRKSCTTGQAVGDKISEGDLKTPEGVYFITGKRTADLDFKLYGDLAFPLNYPNPVDRLNGKTGGGIWVHGRGRDITPRETRGCVALNQEDIHALEPQADKGVPVVIAREVAWDSPSAGNGTEAESARVLQDLQGWVSAWSAQSPEFFSYYDPEKYSKAHRTSFSGFRRHKEGIFRRTPWIDLFVTDIHLLPGPDYWVTWFGQYYRSPNFSSAITKRLYWQRNKAGRFVIVGVETARPPRDIREKYLEHVESRVRTFVNGWQAAWEKADVQKYASFYDADAEQDNRQGIGQIAEHKRQLWAGNPPESVALSGLEVSEHPKGLELRLVQDYASQGGYKDTGIKHLIVRPDGNSWKIVKETWTGSTS